MRSPSASRPAASARRGQLNVTRLWDVLAGHVVPGSVFALLLLNQASHTYASIVAALGPGPSLTGGLRAANAALILVYFALLAALYLFRLPPRGADRRPWIVAASFAGTFMVMAVPLLPAGGRHDWLLLPADISTLLGIAGAVWSLGYLRRSFAILPQARRLVTGGPYGMSRNPLYVAEMVGGWSAYLPTIGWAALLVLVVNIGLLLVRVRAEERILAASFGDEYLEYRRRVPRFVPNPRRLLRAARAAAARGGLQKPLSAVD
jgi:protein-S-isoprenylcysteine O-methyltransferase Ste14